MADSIQVTNQTQCSQTASGIAQQHAMGHDLGFIMHCRDSTPTLVMP